MCYETHMENTWKPYKSPLIAPRNNCCKDFEHTWNMPGICLNPLKFHAGSILHQLGKHLEHTWNLYESTQIPHRFHLGKHLKNTWNIPGIHINPFKFHLDSNSSVSLEHAWN
jgi:hypothetical protein